MSGNKARKLESWNTISEKEKLNILLNRSEEYPQLIYKHSTRCSVSYVAKQELDQHKETLSDHADLHLINVIEQRDLSNLIAERLNVRHESPQVLVLKNRQVIWSGSHWSVKGKEILSKIG